MISVGILGASGKMGKELISLLLSNAYPNLILKCAFVAVQSSLKNKKITDAITYETLSLETLKNIDVLIDFSECSATLHCLPLLRELRKPAVIGTTGFSDMQKSEIKKLAEAVPVVFSPNTSLGVNALFQLVQKASQLLPKDFSPNILEIHHADKKDAPSGTAKKLKEEILRGIRSLGGPQDDKKNISIESIREGDVIGEHTVFFLSSGERLELTHRATSRDIFARGALKAAEWLVHQKSGLYDMQDVLEGDLSK